MVPLVVDPTVCTTVRLNVVDGVHVLGKFRLWSAFWLIALAGAEWWTAIGSAVLAVLLGKISSAALTERGVVQRSAGYQA